MQHIVYPQVYARDEFTFAIAGDKGQELGSGGFEIENYMGYLNTGELVSKECIDSE